MAELIVGKLEVFGSEALVLVVAVQGTSEEAELEGLRLGFEALVTCPHLCVHIQS